MILVDTGPLVALLNRRDTLHSQAVAVLTRAPRPWITCEAVLSEAFFLLRRAVNGTQALAELMRRGALGVGFTLRGNEPAVTSLMAKYNKVPMSFADACLVHICALDKRVQLATFDAEFDIYRVGRAKIPRFS